MRDRATGQPIENNDRAGGDADHPFETVAIVLSLFLLFPWLFFQTLTPPFQMALVAVSLIDMAMLGVIYYRRRKRYHRWISEQRGTASSGAAMIKLPGIVGAEPQEQRSEDDARDAGPDSDGNR